MPFGSTYFAQGGGTDFRKRRPGGFFADAFQPPAAGYLNRLRSGGGLLDNAGAMANFQSSGFMPSVTVGGAFGRGGPMIGDGSDDMPQPIRLPKGTFFQGAIPGMVSYGGGQRQGFQTGDAPTMGESRIPGGYAQWNALTSGGSQNQPFGAGPQPLPDGVQLSRRMPSPGQPDAATLAGNRQDWEQHRAALEQFRGQNVYDKARFRTGNLTPEERLQFGVPGFAVAQQQAGAQLAALEQQNNQFTARNQLGWGQLAQKQADSTAQMDAGIIGAAAALGQIPGGAEMVQQAMQRMQQRFGNPNGGGQPAGPPQIKSAQLPTATQAKIREHAAANNEGAIRQELVRAGVTDREKQNEVIREATGNPRGGLGFWDMPVNPMMPGVTRGRAMGNFFGRFGWGPFGPTMRPQAAVR